MFDIVVHNPCPKKKRVPIDFEKSDINWNSKGKKTAYN